MCVYNYIHVCMYTLSSLIVQNIFYNSPPPTTFDAHMPVILIHFQIQMKSQHR